MIGKILAGIGVGIVVLGVIVVGALVGIYNTCNSHENGLTASWTQNQNVLDKKYKTILEQAQVPAMYTKDVIALATAQGKTRYGPGGSRAVMQFIKEQNSSIDSSLYNKLMQSVEGANIDFATAQTSFIDKKRIYTTYLGTAITGNVAKFMGFPKIDLNAMGIVTSDSTQQAFKTLKSEPLKLTP